MPPNIKFVHVDSSDVPSGPLKVYETIDGPHSGPYRKRLLTRDWSPCFLLSLGADR